MRKSSVVFELTDGEIRAFWFLVPSFRKQVHRSSAVRFDRIPIPTGIIEQGNVRNEIALRDILSTYEAQHSGKSHRAYLAIPLQQGFIRAYRLPWFPKRDRESAISLLVDEEISIERTDILYDYLVVSEEKHKSLQILLGSTRKSMVERYVLIFGQAGFKIVGVDFTFSVLGQVLGFEANEDVLYLQGGSDCCQIAMFRGAVPESVRTLHAPQKRLTLPTTEENGESVNDRTEEWENEIRRFLLYCRTQQPDLNLLRLVWTGDLLVNQLAQKLLASNHVSSVEEAKIRHLPDTWRKFLDKNNGRVEGAVGYGLRIAVNHSEFNLWRQPNTALTVQRRYLGIVFFIAAIFIIGTITWFSLYQMALPLKQEIQLLSSQGAKIEAQAKRQIDLEVAWKQVKIHPEKIGDGLAQIQALSGSELKIEQVIYKKGIVSLRGNANDSRSVQTLIRSLRSLGWEQPALSSYEWTTLNNIQFFLSAKQRQAGMDEAKATQDI